MQDLSVPVSKHTSTVPDAQGEGEKEEAAVAV